MWYHYFKVALRVLFRNKLYSLVNIFGLVAGMTISVLILLYIIHEYSYDKFHVQAEQIYQVYGEHPGGYTNKLSARFGAAVQESNSSVEKFTRIKNMGRAILKRKQSESFFEEKFLFADSTFLSVFSFALIEGDKQSALKRPMTVLLTNKSAEKYFGSENPIGKILTYNNQFDFEVTGVLQAPPSNSTLDFDFIASFSSIPALEKARAPYLSDDEIAYFSPSVFLGAYELYLLLGSPDAAEQVASSFLPLAEKYSGMQSLEGFNFFMAPLLDKHLNSPLAKSSIKQYLNIFMGIAWIILILSLINYISLAIARATQRIREVGIRKALGGSRLTLVKQFYLESAIMVIVPFILSILLVLVLRSYFFQSLQLEVDEQAFKNPIFLGTLMGFFVFSILVTGMYPAFIQSGFKPVEALKNKLALGGNKFNIQKAFIVLQFTISVGLIIGSIVVQRQLNYLKNYEIGIAKEQVMVVPLNKDLAPHYHHLRQQIKAQKGVQGISAASIPLYKSSTMAFMTQKPQTKEDVMISIMSIDRDFIPVMNLDWEISPSNMELLEAQNSIILNQAAQTQLELGNNPLFQQLHIGNQDYSVVGVFEDFNYVSLHESVKPLVMFFVSDTSTEIASTGGCLFVKMQANENIRERVASIEQVYQSYSVEKPFEYYFLDDAFNELYASEDRLAKVFWIFTIATIIIACLGLFGLATYVALRRTKEIGIRKVLGASVGQIVMLISKDFLRLALVANFIAFPLAWWLLNQWLVDYPYRIDIGLWIFLLAGGLSLLTTFLSISYQTILAALNDPVEAIATE